jgi:DNA-binding NarL/FixJ family response regulator
LSEDLASWPANAWLVLDDYHEITPEPRAEDFVEALVALSPVQVLIASRVRPKWIATKEIMYGGVLEMNQTLMAMDNVEAASVLVERTESSTSGLVALARGWPAVIGLASVSEAEIGEGGYPVPDSLYTYFADEVFSALDRDVQEGIATISVAPVLDAEIGQELLGAASFEATCTAALDVGLLVERGHRLELHPLARAFLDVRTVQLGLVPSTNAARACLAIYRRRRDWDAAFELISRFALVSELADLVVAALDELLESARLPTLIKWSDYARLVGLDEPGVGLARAETALRLGHHLEAIAHATAAARSAGRMQVRALLVAGRAAHLASLEDEALALFQSAETAAESPSERLEARWGQLMCAIELELPHAESWLRELNAAAQVADARDQVRSAAFGLSFQVKLGDVDLAEADRAYALIELVADPLLVSSFESTYSAVLGLAARYPDARRVADRFLETIERYRLDFALAYALCARSIAVAGLREWGEAESNIRRAVHIAEQARDDHAHQLCLSQLSRVLTQLGRAREAIDLEYPTPQTPLPSAQAEAACSQALAHASLGQVEHARELVQSVQGVSRAVEPEVLARAAEAICALKARDRDLAERVHALEESAFRRGAVDLLVTSYRSVPELLGVAMRVTANRDRLARLVRKAGDGDLADFLGHPVTVAGDPRKTLTSRQREVYEFMLQGLKNREIARLLFIEESTVKAHAHSIYDKMGPRSRTGLIVQAMLEREGQATSATDATEDSGSV